MPDRQHMRPLWPALLLVPLVPPVVESSWQIAAAWITGRVSGLDGWRAVAPLLGMVFVMVLVASCAVTLVLGVPLVWWLRTRGLLTARWICTGAAVVGLLAGAADLGLFLWWAPAMAARSAMPEFLGVLPEGLLLGLVSGLFFCAVAGVPIRLRAPA